jgi:hypothetical protein
VCSVEGQRRWQLATSTGWPHGPRVGLRRRSPLGASPGPALEAPRAVVPRVLPRRTSREQRWRQSVWPNDDRAPPCTVALPYRFPALLYEDVLPCYVPRGLLLHSRPWTQLTVCAHRHLASLRWFSAPPPRLGGSHTDPTMSKRCARERTRNSTRPFLDADGYLIGLTWLCLSALSQGLVFHDRSLP